MPELIWPGKQLSASAPASIVLDSIVYPHGHGYPGIDFENRLIMGDNLALMTS
jgi:hypothetical protein